MDEGETYAPQMGGEAGLISGGVGQSNPVQRLMRGSRVRVEGISDGSGVAGFGELEGVDQQAGGRHPVHVDAGAGVEEAVEKSEVRLQLSILVRRKVFVNYPSPIGAPSISKPLSE